MIDVTFNAECAQVMRDCGIPPNLARTAVNSSGAGIFTNSLLRFAVAHWFNDDELLLVDALVTKKESEPEQKGGRILEVTTGIVLALCSTLPAGTVTRDMSLEEILAVVAESFGRPVTCHPDQPASHLYSGPWDGQEIHIQFGGADGLSGIMGSHDRSRGCCELVWMCEISRYHAWLAASQISILSSRMRTVGTTQLAELSRGMQDLVETISDRHPGVQPTPEFVQFDLAMNILRLALGDNWCQRNIFGAVAAQGRFQVYEPGKMDAWKAQIHVMQLGEMLFNLQVISGFGEWLRALASRDLDSAVAEAESAALLARSYLRFRFPPLRGEGCPNYDIDMELPSGAIAACEVKNKRNTTPLSAKRLLRSLKKAARQVPKDRPGIIFLKFPEAWIGDKGISPVVDAALDQLFRDSGRMIAVVFLWEVWQELPTGGLTYGLMFREYINQNSRFFTDENAHLIRSAITRLDAGNWVSFAELSGSRVLGMAARSHDPR